MYQNDLEIIKNAQRFLGEFEQLLTNVKNNLSLCYKRNLKVQCIIYCKTRSKTQIFMKTHTQYLTSINSMCSMIGSDMWENSANFEQRPEL